MCTVNNIDLSELGIGALKVLIALNNLEEDDHPLLGKVFKEDDSLSVEDELVYLKDTIDLSQDEKGHYQLPLHLQRQLREFKPAIELEILSRIARICSKSGRSNKPKQLTYLQKAASLFERMGLSAEKSEDWFDYLNGFCNKNTPTSESLNYLCKIQLTLRNIISLPEAAYNTFLADSESDRDHQITIKLARIASQLGLYKEARTLFKEAKTRFGPESPATNDDLLELYTGLIWVLHRDRDSVGLEVAISEAQNISHDGEIGTQVDFLITYGRILAEQGNMPESLAVLNEASILLGLITAGQTISPAAFEPIIKSGKKLQKSQALLAHSLGRASLADAPMAEAYYRAAMAIYEHADVEDHLSAAVIKNNLVDILYSMNQSLEAKELKDEVQKYVEKTGDYLIILPHRITDEAFTLHEEGEWKEALILFKVGQELYPKIRNNCLYGEANILAQLGKWGEAESKFSELAQRAQAQDDQEFIARGHNVWAHTRLMHYEAMEQELEEAVSKARRITNSNLQAYYGVDFERDYAQIYLDILKHQNQPDQLGDWSEHIEKIISKFDFWYVTECMLLLKGRLSLLKGELSQAREAFQRCQTAQNPRFPTIHKAWAAYYEGLTLYKMGNDQEAIRKLKQAVCDFEKLNIEWLQQKANQELQKLTG